MSYNLPPGVSVSDIPGNRPEDLAEEAWWEKLGELCPDVPAEVWDDERVQKLVESARDLAYSCGYDEGRADEALAAAMRESESAEPQPQEPRESDSVGPQEPDPDLVEAIESGELDADLT